MRRLIFIPILLITFFTTTSFLSVDVDLSGKIYSDNIEINKQLIGLQLFVKYKGEIVAETNTDKEGHYEMSINVSLSNGLTNTYDFYITGIGIDTSFIKAITQFDGEEMKWDIKLPNAYKKKHGQTICPKCEKSDKIYPVVYGMKQKSQINIVNGDTISSNIVDKKYYAGTCISNSLSPKWYCDRDKVKF